MELTEKYIQKLLFKKFPPGPYLYHLCNSFVFHHAWESDFYFQSKSGVHIEVEIKISRSDFRKDALKYRKHEILNRVANKGVQQIPFPHKKDKYAHISTWDDVSLTGQNSSINWFDVKKDPVPNKFYYAAPQGLLDIDEIPDYSGLIQVYNTGELLIVKKAPIIHNVKHSIDHILLKKLYWKYINHNFYESGNDFPAENDIFNI
jgi:hypothetical protein